MSAQGRPKREFSPEARSANGTPVTAASQRVLVLGGSGFVGRHVVAKLSAAGHDVVVLTRRRESARHLLPLPTVRVVEADPYSGAALDRHAADITAAINLVGVLHEKGRDTFERAHVELPGLLAATCRKAGAARILHMSALGASVEAPSKYLRSKAQGEAEIERSGLAWTIFRPSIIFGREDTFLNLFARLARLFPALPLAGAHARFQPVYVRDVATCFAKSLGDPGTVAERYALCGPKSYTLEELVRYVGQVTGHPRPIVPLGAGLASLQARVMEWLPGPLMTRDNLASMQVDNVCEGPFPARFGITPAPLEAIAPGYLAPAAQHSRFDEFRAHGGR